MDHIWDRIIEHKKENRLISRQINEYILRKGEFNLKNNYRKEAMYSEFNKLKLRLFCDNIRENGEIPHNITDLDLSFNDTITGRGIPKNIKKLVLTGNMNIINKDLERLELLNEIDLRGNKKITIEGIKKIPSLIGIAIDKTSLVKIGELQQLTNINVKKGLQLTLSEVNNDDFKEIIENLSNKIKILNIEIKTIKYTGIIAGIDISKMENIEYINIRTYDIGHWERIKSTLDHNSSIMEKKHLKEWNLIHMNYYFYFHGIPKYLKGITIEVYRSNMSTLVKYKHIYSRNEIDILNNCATYEEYEAKKTKKE